MAHDRLEQWVGAATVAVLIALIVLLNSKSAETADAGDQVVIDALFGQVDGIAVGDKVRVSGIPMGQVSGLSLNKRGQAVLTLSLDADANLPNDSSASIQTDGLFGTKFVIFEPGFAEETFKSGDVVTVTQDSVIVSSLLELIISQGYANLEARKAEANKPQAGN